MAATSLNHVLEELTEEGHEPMANLLRAISRQDFASSLGYDLSMLRLWLSRSLAEEPELMVTYADGRQGGRPSPPLLDAYELTFFRDTESGPSKADLKGTIDQIRAWALAAR